MRMLGTWLMTQPPTTASLKAYHACAQGRRPEPGTTSLGTILFRAVIAIQQGSPLLPRSLRQTRPDPLLPLQLCIDARGIAKPQEAPRIPLAHSRRTLPAWHLESTRFQDGKRATVRVLA